MNKVVYEVFTLMGWMLLATILYWIFFGQKTSDGRVIWKGALTYACEAIEKPIAEYYFDYCYEPNIGQYGTYEYDGSVVTSSGETNNFSNDDSTLDSQFYKNSELSIGSSKTWTDDSEGLDTNDSYDFKKGYSSSVY